MAASRAARRLAALFAAEGEAGTPAGARARGRGGRRAPGLARARAAVAAWARRRAAVGLLGSRLFWKFASLLAVLVLSASVITFATSQWYAYRESRAAQFRLLREQALAASGRIEAFVGGIAHELGWVTQLPWSAQTPEMRVQDAVRLLRQAPAVSDLRLLDPAGREQVFVSRTELDRTGPGRDLAADPLFREARDAGSAFGPVTFRGGSEPFMTVAAAGPGGRTGVAVADVNLKLVWDVIRRVRVGETGRAFVVDRDGRLVAHPDIDRVLRATDLSRLPHIREATGAPAGATGVRAGEAAVEAGEDGAPALASWVAIPGLGWAVVAELPRTEADAPLRAAIGRTALLLLGGVAVSTGAGLLLARHLVGPIRLLGQGAARIGAGELGHRLVVRTGDELQVLAERFNAMSDALREAAARNERLGRLKRFLSPQLAELVEFVRRRGPAREPPPPGHGRLLRPARVHPLRQPGRARGGDAGAERVPRRARPPDLRLRGDAGALHGRRADGAVQRPAALPRPVRPGGSPGRGDARARRPALRGLGAERPRAGVRDRDRRGRRHAGTDRLRGALRLLRDRDGLQPGGTPVRRGRGRADPGRRARRAAGRGRRPARAGREFCR